MKNIMKYVLALSFLSALYYGANLWMNANQQMITNSRLLIQYGVIIGYYLLIIFIVVIQINNYRQLISYKPIFGKVFMALYHALSAGFLVIALMHYNFQKTLTLMMLFLSMSIVFELIRDRMIEIKEGNLKHPKKIY